MSAALTDEAIAIGLGTPLEVLIACQLAGTGTDVTAELAALDIPVLVVQGDRDQSTPLELTGRPTDALIPDSRLIVYPGAPHGLYITHRDQLTKDLLTWLPTP